MDETIANRVREMLHDYYPNDHFMLKNVNRVKTKSKSHVYKISIFDHSSGYRDLYAKKYHKELSTNIHEIMGLVTIHDMFSIPKILDYHDGIIISEGVKGDTLTKSLLKNAISRDRSTLINCSQKIALAIGSLQRLTHRGSKRIGDLDIKLIRDFESHIYFKKILERDLLKDIRVQVESLKKLSTDISQYHGDPTPHNILLKNDKVHILDHSFQDNATFLDPSFYIVSLELARHRYGFPLRNTISQMENIFKETYSEMTKEAYDMSTWTTIKTLTYLHFLRMYSYRERTIAKTLVSSIDRPYLLNQIRRMNNANSW